ncbi:alpha/beta hydrolase [Scatolibacter rhodanostii]|uniref:alpha/beta hydrolase n=1 Tax=Scatolibacter rhodanostii TaxID=2014781 RepID=UPI000C0786A3|nr:alpha/beta hydrolase [Scatolibacter rhodanostii]
MIPAILVLSVLFLLFVLVSYCLFYFACVRVYTLSDEPAGTWKKYADRIYDCRKWLRDHTTEKIECTSFDGLKLISLFVPAENPKGTIIVMHGYRSRSDMDFVPEVEFLNGLGYNLLVVMQRSHDESEGKYITFGVKERFDCKMWAEYVAKRFGNEQDIFLSGISMGAATVLMASGLDLPSNVRGIIADCGFTSAWEIVKRVGKKDMHLPCFPFVYGVNFFAKRLAKFDLKEYSTLDAMKLNRLPILFIHGDADDFVPITMTMQNYKACKAPKELLVIRGAAHATSYLSDTELCQKAILDFVNQYAVNK